MIVNNSNRLTRTVFHCIVQCHGGRHSYSRISHDFSPICEGDVNSIVKPNARYRPANAFDCLLEISKETQSANGMALSSNDFQMGTNLFQRGVR